MIWRNTIRNQIFMSGLALARELEIQLDAADGVSVFPWQPAYTLCCLHTCNSCIITFKSHNQVRKNIQQAFVLQPSHHSFFHNSSDPISLPKPTPIKQIGYNHLHLPPLSPFQTHRNVNPPHSSGSLRILLISSSAQVNSCDKNDVDLLV
jgi:hypothetical protein